MTRRLADILREVAAAFRAADVRFAVVGGLAVSVRTEPRFTRDVDLAVAAADDPEAEAIVGILSPAYEPVAVLEHETLDRLAAVRLSPAGEPEAGVVVDLLFASSGIESEVVAAAETVEVFAGLGVPVATTGALLALKLLARDDSRPLDAADLRTLLQVAETEDLATAEHLVDRIMRRGANRGRDLRHEWAALVAGAREEGDPR